MYDALRVIWDIFCAIGEGLGAVLCFYWEVFGEIICLFYGLLIVYIIRKLWPMKIKLKYVYKYIKDRGWK